MSASTSSSPIGTRVAVASTISGGWLARLREHDPRGSCEAVLEPIEWQLLYRETHETREVPSEAPTLEEALIRIAKPGGYIARLSDPPPGVISRWRGWERLAELVDDYRDICGSSQAAEGDVSCL